MAHAHVNLLQEPLLLAPFPTRVVAVAPAPDQLLTRALCTCAFVEVLSLELKRAKNLCATSGVMALDDAAITAALLS